MYDLVHFLYLNYRLQYINVGDNDKPRALYYNLEVKVAHAAERPNPTYNMLTCEVCNDIVLRHFTYIDTKRN